MSANKKTVKPRPAFESPSQKCALMDRAVNAAKDGKLVAVIGSGVSIGLTDGQVPSWTGLIKNGFQYAHKRGRLSDTQLAHWSALLGSSDIDDLLSAAEFVGRKLGSPDDALYGRWLQELFGNLKVSNSQLALALQALVAHGIPICTLNYDPLLELVTGLQAIQVSETSKAMAWLRREIPGILHLHGSWDSPHTCILGIRDYETTLTDEVRDLFQRNLAAFNHLLFIGCGDTLADPNFSALISWLQSKLRASTPQHVALTREDEVARRIADPAWVGFVEPVNFGCIHSDLAQFLLGYFPKTARKITRPKNSRTTPTDTTVVNDYMSFLIRDCGQMTIEGVSADFDTGQRKFDLERLFVPLNVSACPPAYPPNDPDAAAKLEKWHIEHNREAAFGEALSKNKRLALLALPGGGKTLLLKRLAVAYADPSRRPASPDNLPDIHLIPVLIRCREWRDYINQPIPTLLKSISDITGQPQLRGLADALVPALKRGDVLLLIDGLDEIHNDADRTTFVDHLESFLDQYKKIRIVITSREAGFNLVAPSISRFCERWRLAPLSEAAIEMLCEHWHRLMIGDSPSALSEGREVADILVKRSSLRRLAENPLLLTMLLVVKHGRGGLPPDRVTLYGRAVDVLLDTWNIKGHEPLNPKEAVPQLAYVAFQLMREGKQTATEKELLKLLEDAREKHPNIRRYAKDSPHEFLKRVELRSSLLLEAGYQMEGSRSVPFYQFRHLTFQEYLSAVAATEGHYREFHQDDTVLTPLDSQLLADEWKEVIPMAAVLARKRAEPLLAKLIEIGNIDRQLIETNKSSFKSYAISNQKIGGIAGLLIQCFVEEVESSPETISAALQLIAYFAHGCKSIDDWNSLCKGPFGEELFKQAWGLVATCNLTKTSWSLNNCAGIAAFQKSLEYWLSDQGKAEVGSLLQSVDTEQIGRGALISMGMLWNWSQNNESDSRISAAIQLDLIEPHLFHENATIQNAAIWTWTNTRRQLNYPKPPSASVLDLLFEVWRKGPSKKGSHLAGYALGLQLGMPRDTWKPKVTPKEAKYIRNKLSALNTTQPFEDQAEFLACIFIAHHAQSIFSDEELSSKLSELEKANKVQFGGMKIAKIRSALTQASTSGA